MYHIRGQIELFPGRGGWSFVRVPPDVLERVLHEGPGSQHYGMVPVEAELGGSTWRTSLMPTGDGGRFIPLNKGLMKKERLAHGDEVDIRFRLRGG